MDKLKLDKFQKQRKERRTIEIRLDTREALKALGKKGDTYDIIINRLIEGRVRNEDRI